MDSYVDIFNGRPIAAACVAMLRTVVSSLNVELRGDAGVEAKSWLVANMERAGFRATLTHGESLQMMRPVIQRLGLAEGVQASVLCGWTEA